jgi:hypothetical protein
MDLVSLKEIFVCLSAEEWNIDHNKKAVNIEASVGEKDFDQTDHQCIVRLLATPNTECH